MKYLFYRDDEVLTHHRTPKPHLRLRMGVHPPLLPANLSQRTSQKSSKSKPPRRPIKHKDKAAPLFPNLSSPLHRPDPSLFPAPLRIPSNLAVCPQNSRRRYRPLSPHLLPNHQPKRIPRSQVASGNPILAIRHAAHLDPHLGTHRHRRAQTPQTRRALPRFHIQRRRRSGRRAQHALHHPRAASEQDAALDRGRALQQNQRRAPAR
jgi:hypothetical protein